MKPWHYDTAEDLDQTLIERLRGFPREPDMFVYAVRSAAALAMRGWLRAYHRLQVMGCEHLPAEGSFVMVANHASHLDALCLLSVLPLRKLHRAFPAAAADYFFTSVPRLAMAAVLVNALPFHREIHARQSLGLCQQLLSNTGNILIIFPEGTRSTTGEIGEFKRGIGALLAGTNIPVVPCHLAGAFDAWPKGRLVPRPCRLTLRIGPARTFTAQSRNKQTVLQISHELRQAVLELAALNRLDES